eukprot:TRINITY_DN41168_c0_g1_i1.p1 TRINITY_DN41168_c0_g1~~TRINITY_DN41168_c0_g1_i1.p1  ORF type:complete len:336 (-),score=70.60 TRINITY_DN41168_c0_g1_i1:235-1242(-)
MDKKERTISGTGPRRGRKTTGLVCLCIATVHHMLQMLAGTTCLRSVYDIGRHRIEVAFTGSRIPSSLADRCKQSSMQRHADNNEDDWLRGIRDSLGSRESDLEATVKAQQEEMAQLRTESEGRQEELDMSLSNATGLADELRQSEVKYSQLEEESRKQKEKLEQSCAKADALEKQLCIEQARAEEAERSLDSAQAKVTDLQEKLQESEEQVEDIRSQVENLQLDLKRELSSKKELLEQISTLQQSYSALNDELEESQTEAEQRKSDQSRLSSELQASITATDRLDAELRHATEQLETATARMSTIRGSLGSAMNVFVDRMKRSTLRKGAKSSRDA